MRLTFRGLGEQIEMRAPIARGQHMEKQRPRPGITGPIAHEAQHVLEQDDRRAARLARRAEHVHRIRRRSRDGIEAIGTGPEHASTRHRKCMKRNLQQARDLARQRNGDVGIVRDQQYRPGALILPRRLENASQPRRSFLAHLLRPYAHRRPRTLALRRVRDTQTNSAAMPATDSIVNHVSALTTLWVTLAACVRAVSTCACVGLYTAGGGRLSVRPALNVCAASKKSACSPRRSSSRFHFASGRCGNSFETK